LTDHDERANRANQPDRVEHPEPKPSLSSPRRKRRLVSPGGKATIDAPASATAERLADCKPEFRGASGAGGAGATGDTDR